MTLYESIAAAGMTPPREIVEGRWLRFPGVGKGGSNRAGWCRLITPTLAIFGDWSSGIKVTWQDKSHRDCAESRRLLAEARRRAQEFERERRQIQTHTAKRAAELISACGYGKHAYLARKGFPDRHELIDSEKHLVIPMRDSRDYQQIISAQLISESGEKKFLPGGRAKGAVFRIGTPSGRPVLCEGFATGLSLHAALSRLSLAPLVIVCFSAQNLEHVAPSFPSAVIAADHDESGAGERAAVATGLKWAMPNAIETDFNDVHVKNGLHIVVETMRELLRQ